MRNSGENDFSGMKALVMGLGLHGGGLESALYLAGKGAQVTVTDLRDEKTLAPSLEKLAGFRLVLGRHEMSDFVQADLVVKNPGVRPDSPFLQAARRVETDISLFLAASPARLSGVTGSKGKSTAASALHWALDQARSEKTPLPGRAFLGGNITISPLTFLDSLGQDDDVTLELSSWQLGDLRGKRRRDGSALLKPRTAVFTAILPDHLDRYGSMEKYVADKKVLFQNQTPEDSTIAWDDRWGREILAETRGRPFLCSQAPLRSGQAGGWVEGGLARPGSGEIVQVLPDRLRLPGAHQRANLLAAALALLDLGLPPDFICRSLGDFPGIEHRLEFFCEEGGIRFYNDSAATIPEAAAAAVDAFPEPPVLITGGTDKGLDYLPLVKAAARAKAVVLLEGTGTDKFRPLLDEGGVKYQGPFGSLEDAVRAAIAAAAKGSPLVLSPGCTSFGMFLNEFDRGRRFKETVFNLTGRHTETDSVK
jgi:UDP-N-acetylmuramoylalanine--D-glutamate ligase